MDRTLYFGQFLLTGSAVPADVSQLHHSGVGRVARLLMRPMSLFESGDSNGSVSLSELFNGTHAVDGKNTSDIEQLAFFICCGGWPKALECSERVALAQAQDYYAAVVEVDLTQTDRVARSPERIRRLMRSYARAVASQTALRTMAQDVHLSEETVASYVAALKKIFVIEEMEAWNPNIRSKTAIRTSHTRYFTDPSIGVAALGVTPKDLLQDLPTMGLFFENLCMRDLRVYAERLGGTVYHYRDKSGLECDAVVYLSNGAYGLIEIKLGGAQRIEEGVDVLQRLSSQMDTRVMPPPSFQMVLIGVGDYAYTRKDGVHVVPIGCLKP